ncbi:MAG: sulfatase [PVC group bacterium]
MFTWRNGKVIVLSLASCLLSLSPLSSYSEDHPPPPPDIILFSIDTLRADHLGCYGYERETSPFIDSFVNDGVLFEHVISQSAHTAPSHMSIFTALLPDVHGVSNYTGGKNQRLAPLNPTLAEVLRDHGYMTVGIHGGGNVDAGHGFDTGFDYYEKDFNLDSTRPGEIPPEINYWIDRSREAGKPLFLFLHHYFCHVPYLHGPRALRCAVLKEPVEGLPTGPGDLTREQLKDNSEFWKMVDISDPRQRAHLVALYDGGILIADHLFRKTVELLKQKGIYKDSMIILTSDHGEEFYEHGSKGHGTLFIEHLHVPLVIKFPGGKYAGKRIDSYVRLVDLMPLICQMADSPLPPGKQGISFLPLLAGEGFYHPLIVSNHAGKGYELRFYKDGYVYADKKYQGVPEWLFDPEKDPHEQKNLAGEKPEVLKKMRKAAEEAKAEKYKFTRGLEKVVEPPPPSEELKKQLKALGYL